jgi:dihydroorotate dehydrogenase subfamily 2
MSSRKFTFFLIVLALLGIIDAGYLTYEHYSYAIPPCTTNIFIDCGKVLRSSYSEVFGIPLALLGLIYYATISGLMLLIIKNNKKLFKRKQLFKYGVLVFSSFGFLFSAYLVYLQLIVIGSICLYCMASAIISTSIFVIAQITFVNERKKTAIQLTALFYKTTLRKLLFTIDSEKIHDFATVLGFSLGKSKIAKGTLDYLYNFKSPRLEKKLAGIEFNNPIGLAAGFDYDASLTQMLPSLGFGFATVGTVTNLPYGGNPKPRLGRLVRSRSLLVNKGFKSEGADKIVEKLKGVNFEIPIGISIGRSNSPKLKTQKSSVADIISAFKKFERAKIKNAYYELNISCPNLIHGGNISFYPQKNLESLLIEVDRLKLKKPLFVKMPIEKSEKVTLAMLKVIAKHSPVGVIFGNLQKDKKHPTLDQGEVNKFKMGFYSGKPTYEQSNKLIELTHKNFKSRFIIIGCGGIFSAEDAYKKLSLGASLVQLITGLIYEGPQLIGQLNTKLSNNH